MFMTGRDIPIRNSRTGRNRERRRAGNPVNKEERLVSGRD